MNKQFVEEWLNKLKNYWFNKNIDNAVALFKNTTFYQETPFMKPYTTLEEINEEWQHVKNENIQSIEIKPLAIDGYTVIAQWILKILMVSMKLNLMKIWNVFTLKVGR